MSGRIVELGPARALIHPGMGLRLDRIGEKSWRPQRFTPVRFGPVTGVLDLPSLPDLRLEGWVDGEEVDILEEWFAATARPNTASHLGLFTTTPADDGTGGVEVTGGSYAREAYARNGTNWGNTSAGAPSTIENLVTVSFTQATANWGTVASWGYNTALTVGTWLFFAVLDAAKAIDNGDTAQFAPAGLTAQLGDPSDTY